LSVERAASRLHLVYSLWIRQNFRTFTKRRRWLGAIFSMCSALRPSSALFVPGERTSDHGVSEALYLRDPDQNGVELYCDHPREQWPHLPDGGLTMFTRPLDLDSLLAEANSK
jgi:catechol-2,3-dioxygenase